MALAVLGVVALTGQPNVVRAQATDALEPAPASVLGNTTWPISVAPSKRHFLDRNGRPILLVADSAWSLLVSLSRSEVTRYLDERAARGVNLLKVSLIEHDFSPNSPAWKNSYGQSPFRSGTDFSKPNGAYFDHVDWVIRQALARNIGILLSPAHLGAGCGGQGWYKTMVANGPTRLAVYGRYIGNRFNKYPNVIWMHAGDCRPDATGLSLVAAVRDAILSAGGSNRLLTYHFGGDIPPSADTRLPRLDFDTLYSFDTGRLAWHALEAMSANAGLRPYFFVAGRFENEYRSKPWMWREQFYVNGLAGSAGFAFGNYPIWTFWQPGDPDYIDYDDNLFPKGWTQALASPGAQQLKIAARFLRSHRWYRLQPVLDGTLVVAGAGKPDERGYVLASRSADRRTGVLYFPRQKSVTIDLSAMAGTRISARWFNPVTGKYAELRGSPFKTTQMLTRTSPAPRSDGSSDWLLVLRTLE